MVEKYWDDITIYFVEYLSKNKKINGEKSIVSEGTFIFETSLALEDVIKCIQREINDVLEVINIDEFSDGMVLKKVV